MEFIEQIKNLDFEKETDIKLLYEKANDIETQITNVDYNGNSASVERFFEVTEKLNDKIPDIIIIRIPKFRAITSGAMSYEDVFGKFRIWQEAHNDFFSPLFLTLPIFCAKTTEILNGYGALRTKLQKLTQLPMKLLNTPAGCMLLR
ncbi:MAG: hypothetical protein HDT44_10745 [Ruminococcaceae bacterium]|nr:hypothetical protein [Oscillospiraceae bacterium]